MSKTMTPYAAATIVNKQLADQGIEKKLPPQMLYTYVSKGYIKSVTVDGKKRVTEAALKEWFVGYVNKLTKTNKTENTNTEPSVWNFGDLVESETTEDGITEVAPNVFRVEDDNDNDEDELLEDVDES